MGDILTEVQRWRTKADELRAATEQLTNPVARDSLLQMADGYDQLADAMEDREIQRRARMTR
jgi:uncharacterized protein Yka (UPF0111/DUF47 family)